MKKEIAHQLADAITSGHYTRTSGTNRRVDPKTFAQSFCIGGVLINMFAQAHPDIAAKETDRHMFLGHSSSLPDAVVSWAGMRNSFMDAIGGKNITIAGHEFDGLQSANDQRVGNKPNSAFRVSWADMAAWLKAGENYKLI